ncbi:MAG: mannonate dehydratase [Paraburkholderia sp.]|jgi:hypothetical protein|nr:mannonate dehydratase [Paraburkholderia sp.]
MHLPDGSTTLAFDTQAIRELDVSQGIQLPGWDASYRPEHLRAIIPVAKQAVVYLNCIWEGLAKHPAYHAAE